MDSLLRLRCVRPYLFGAHKLGKDTKMGIIQ